MIRNVKIDLSNPMALPLLGYLESLPFAEVEKETKSFADAVAECDGRPAGEFFDELRRQVKEHFRNA